MMTKKIDYMTRVQSWKLCVATFILFILSSELYKNGTKFP